MDFKKYEEIIWKEVLSRQAISNSKLSEFMIRARKSCIFVLWWANIMSYHENWVQKFQDFCTTSWALKEFWNNNWENGTPLWIHSIKSFIWDWFNPMESLIGRKPHWIINRSELWDIQRVAVGRVIQLQWEEPWINDNTLQRNIYIHGTPNEWYWESGNLKRTLWCISLRSHKMVELFEQVNKNFETIVYISEAKRRD